MAESSAAQRSCSIEVVVDLVRVGGGDESSSGFALDPTHLARGLSIGVWLNYLRLSLPVGSKFLVQSHGRWVSSQEIGCEQQGRSFTSSLLKQCAQRARL